MNEKDFLNSIQDDTMADELPETGFIDTGSYTLNALVSGSLYGGFPANRVSMIHGPEASGKSFLCQSAMKVHLDKDPSAIVAFFDTEYAIDRTFFDKRGIDPTRVKLYQPRHLFDFKVAATNLLNQYEKSFKEGKRPPLMIVLDSLGNLPSKKEYDDAEEGKDIRDMSKSQAIRSMFRTLTSKLGSLNVPLLIANHSYTTVGQYIATSVASGGGGPMYASSLVLGVGRKPNKEGDVVTGSIIKIKVEKSRYSTSGAKAEIVLDFKNGLDRYSGLFELAETAEIFKKDGTRYIVPSSDVKVFGKAIKENPEKYFTKEVMELLEDYVQKTYTLGAENSGEIREIVIAEEAVED